MSNTLPENSADDPEGVPGHSAAAEVALTPLAEALAPDASAPYCGALTMPSYGEEDQEAQALLHGAAVYDLGWRGRISLRGEDRVRWLNGMLTNNIGALAEGEGNYNFVLNAQGRIQSDCNAVRHPDSFVLHSTLAQIPNLMAHLDRYIIMDDVELRDDSAESTALGLAGPQALALLRRLGVTLAAPGKAHIHSTQATLAGVPVEILRYDTGSLPRLEILLAPEHILSVWNALRDAGALPVGFHALETVRVLEGTPLYGVDIQDRDLPQETGQMRALNFSKGCYLGQEIVERIRSRGNVHRGLGRFQLSQIPRQLPVDLRSNGQVVGRISSAATFDGAVYGLGITRTEALERRQPLEYEGGVATVAEHPSLLPSPALTS